MDRVVLGLCDLYNTIKVSSDLINSYYPHTHMYNEVLIYEPFEGFITVDGERFVIDSKTLLVVTPTHFHSTSVTEQSGAKYLKIAFGDDDVERSVLSMLKNPIICAGIGSDAMLSELAERLTAFSSDKEKLRIYVNTLLLEAAFKGRYIGKAAKSSGELLVLRAIHTVNESFFEDIDLQSIAKAEHVSPQYLSSLFSKYVGIGFREYLCEKRLKYAEMLLSDGKLNATEVCYKCGYGNLSHFLRSFKRKYGMTPKAYQVSKGK